MLGRFPGDREVLGAAGEHGGVQALAQGVVDTRGARVGGVAVHDRGGQRGGDEITVAFDTTRAGVPPLRERLIGACTASPSGARGQPATALQHVLACMKDWQILRQCRRRGNAINLAARAVAYLWNTKLAHL